MRLTESKLRLRMIRSKWIQNQNPSILEIVHQKRENRSCIILYLPSPPIYTSVSLLQILSAPNPLAKLLHLALWSDPSAQQHKVRLQVVSSWFPFGCLMRTLSTPSWSPLTVVLVLRAGPSNWSLAPKRLNTSSRLWNVYHKPLSIRGVLQVGLRFGLTGQAGYLASQRLSLQGVTNEEVMRGFF